MKCPECIKEGKRSEVTEGFTSSFSQHQPNIWNEEDNLIIKEHTKIVTSTTYYCSNNHEWSETTKEQYNG